MRALSTLAASSGGAAIADEGHVARLETMLQRERMTSIEKRNLIVIDDDFRADCEWAQSNSINRTLIHKTREIAATEEVDAETDTKATLLRACDEIRRFLESPPPHKDVPPHKWAFPHQIMFHGPKSPAAGVLYECMSNVLSKVWQAGTYSSSSDQCGYALSAHYGVGKSTLLRLIACVSGLLFEDKAWVCYVNWSANDLQGITLNDLMVFLQRRMGAVGESDAGGVGKRPLQVADDNGVAMVLLLDELETQYLQPVWGEVVEFAAYPGSCLLSASSSSRFPLIVNGRDIDRICGIYRITPDKVPAKLNGSKLENLTLSPMSKYDEYDTFVSNRWAAFADQPQVDKRDIISRLHHVTGGNFRMLTKQIKNLKLGLPLAADERAKEKLAAVCGKQGRLLQALALTQPRKGYVAPHLEYDEAAAILTAHFPNCSPAQDLDGFAADGCLQETYVPGGKSNFVAEIPFMLSKYQRVFVSHAYDDYAVKTKPLVDFLVQLQVPVESCHRSGESFGAGDERATPTALERKWVAESSASIVVVTDTSVAKFREAPGKMCGVVREVDLIVDRYAADFEAPAHQRYPVVFVDMTDGDGAREEAAAFLKERAAVNAGWHPDGEVSAPAWLLSWTELVDGLWASTAIDAGKRYIGSPAATAAG